MNTQTERDSRGGIRYNVADVDSDGNVDADQPDSGLGEMHKLVLIRHGESVWNQENRFTGWTDVDLSDRGREEARRPVSS